MPDNDPSFSLPNQPPSTSPGQQSSPSLNPPSSPAPQPPDQSPPTPPREILPAMDASGGNSTQGFFSVFKDTFKVIGEKFFVFIGLSLLNVVIVGAAIVVGVPIIFTLAFQAGFAVAPIAMVLFVLLLMLLSYLFYGTLSHQAAATVHEVAAPIGQSVSVTFQSTGKAINLAWKTFIYSGLWLILLLLILFPLVNSLAYTLGNAAGIVMVIANFVLGLGGLVCCLIASIRFVRAILAFPILMANHDLKAQEALDQSVQLTKGKWWMMFSFITVFTFLLGLIPMAVNIAAAMTKINALSIVALVIGAVFAILSYAMNVSFFQVLAEKLSNATITMKLHPGVLIGALLIFLAPIILSVALPLLGIMALQSQFSASDSFSPSTSPNSFMNSYSSGFIRGGDSTSEEQTVTPVDPAKATQEQPALTQQTPVKVKRVQTPAPSPSLSGT